MMFLNFGMVQIEMRAFDVILRPRFCICIGLALLVQNAGAVVFNQTQLMIRRTSFAQTIDELSGNTVSSSISVLQSRVAPTQQDLLHPVKAFYTLYMSPQGQPSLSPLRRVAAGVELGASELMGTLQTSTQARMVGITTRSSPFGVAQFQLRQIARSGAQWADTLIYAVNFTETRDCAIYNASGHITGWMLATERMSSAILAMEGYEVAQLARTSRAIHVFASIGGSGKWLVYHGQSGAFQQRVQVFPPGDPMSLGKLTAVQQGDAEFVFFAAEKGRSELAGFAREHNLRYTPIPTTTEQANIVLTGFAQTGATTTMLLAEVLSQHTRCRWLQVAAVVAAFTDSSNSALRVAVAGSCVVVNSDQEFGLMYVTTLRVGPAPAPATALVAASGKFGIYDEDHLRHRSTFVRSAVFINRATALLVGGETGLWQVSTGSIVEYGDAFVAVWSVFSGNECVYRRFGTPRRDGVKFIVRQADPKPTSPIDEGVFYLAMQWNAAITHDAPENAYSQWRLDLLAVDLQHCNCSRELCVIGPEPVDDTSAAGWKTVLLVVGCVVVAVAALAGVYHYVRRRQTRTTGEHGEPLVNSKQSVQTASNHGFLDP